MVRCPPRIITDNKTWIHHCELESIWQSMERKQPKLPSKKKFKTNHPRKKTDVYSFIGLKNLILEHYQERCTTNSAHYSDVHTDRHNTAQPKMFFSHCIRKLVLEGPNMLKSKGIMLKNDVNVSFLFVLK
jgi:hypothetical protein